VEIQLLTLQKYVMTVQMTEEDAFLDVMELTPDGIVLEEILKVLLFAQIYVETVSLLSRKKAVMTDLLVVIPHVLVMTHFSIA